MTKYATRVQYTTGLANNTPFFFLLTTVDEERRLPGPHCQEWHVERDSRETRERWREREREREREKGGGVYH